MFLLAPLAPVGGFAVPAWATETSTISVGGTEYKLFTGFTATDGNGTNYANLVDGDTSTNWSASKSWNNGDPNAPAGDFNGGTEDPAYVEFHADAPIIPKGYVLTYDNTYNENWKPTSWALKAKLNEGDEWTTIQSSTTTLGAGKTFEIACTNDDDNEYQHFRFEIYNVGTTMQSVLNELQFYGSLPAYTHLTVKAATCTATGIKQACYRRNNDGKYFTDETGTTELAESDVIDPIKPHTGIHHEATDTNIEYWQCSMCGKYFSEEGCTTEITEEQTKIYRTITIDNSISGLVTVGFGETQALAGESIILYVDYQVDASTLKVNNGAVELTAETDIQYTFTMPAANVTVTAEVAQSNADGDTLTGSIRHTVTIPNGASITLNNATITGGIVCNGTATITLVGTNSVSGATNKAGIQVGGSGTTLTIRGDGSLTANGGNQSAGIGLSRAWDPADDVIGGDIVIEGGIITANGGSQRGAGIGTGVIYGNGSAKTAKIGNVTIKGGTVKATGGSEADGIGTGYTYNPCTNAIGTVTIYDGIDLVDASSIKDFASVVYMHGETNVTASKTEYFAIGENGNHRIIIPKSKINIQKVQIGQIPAQTYTGSEITPEPQVTIGSFTLTKGTDYEYSYTNNTNVGTAKVTVTFKGIYASLGTVEKEFTIRQKSDGTGDDSSGDSGSGGDSGDTGGGTDTPTTAPTTTTKGTTFKDAGGELIASVDISITARPSMTGTTGKAFSEAVTVGVKLEVADPDYKKYAVKMDVSGLDWLELEEDEETKAIEWEEDGGTEEYSHTFTLTGTPLTSMDVTSLNVKATVTLSDGEDKLTASAGRTVKVSVSDPAPDDGGNTGGNGNSGNGSGGDNGNSGGSDNSGGNGGNGNSGGSVTPTPTPETPAAPEAPNATPEPEEQPEPTPTPESEPAVTTPTPESLVPEMTEEQKTEAAGTATDALEAGGNQEAAEAFKNATPATAEEMKNAITQATPEEARQAADNATEAMTHQGREVRGEPVAIGTVVFRETRLVFLTVTLPDSMRVGDLLTLVKNALTGGAARLAAEDDDATVFLDSAGKVTKVVPEDRKVTMATIFEGGKTYRPVIVATKPAETEAETGTEDSATAGGGSGGGCDVGLGVLALAAALPLLSRKRCG